MLQATKESQRKRTCKHKTEVAAVVDSSLQQRRRTLQSALNPREDRRRGRARTRSVWKGDVIKRNRLFLTFKCTVGTTQRKLKVVYIQGNKQEVILTASLFSPTEAAAEPSCTPNAAGGGQRSPPLSRFFFFIGQMRSKFCAKPDADAGSRRS